MYHEVEDSNPGLNSDEIIDMLKDKGFTDEGLLRFVSSNANKSTATTMYHKLKDENNLDSMDDNDLLALGFTDGVLRYVRSRANNSDATARYHKIREATLI